MTPSTSAFRIVSLVPSLTETLCHFGLQNSLVGCTNFCIEPVSLRRTVPSVGGTKDASVEKMLALKPTHILTNREENTAALLNSLRSLDSQHGFTLVETFLEAPDDNFELVRKLGEIFLFQERAQLWCAEQKKILFTLRTKMNDAQLFTFAYFIWMNPWMTAGNQTYISRCIELIGGKNVISTGTELNERYPVVQPTDESIQSADVVLFSSEPFPFRNRHIETFRHEAGQKFKCLKVDGQALSWYGSRFAVTLSELESLHVQINEI